MMEEIARRALSRWDLPPDVELELIKQRENAVFSVSTGDARYALRVHRAGYHSDAELRSEHLWTASLRDHGVTTPRTVPTKDGDVFASVSDDAVPDPVQVDLLEWFDGEPIGSVEAGLAHTSSVAETFTRVGELMAETHDHSTGWTPPAGFTRHAWDADGICGEQPLWGRYQDLDGLDDDQQARIERAAVQARRELAAFGTTADRYGLIHADFVPDNLLVGDGGICLIDFDDGGYGWHLFDIATSLFFHLGEDHFDDALSGLIDGYTNRRSLPDDHLALLPLFFVVRGLTYLGWAHSRRETDTAVAMTPILVAGVDELVDTYLGG